jgi:hypothetical protein
VPIFQDFFESPQPRSFAAREQDWIGAFLNQQRVRGVAQRVKINFGQTRPPPQQRAKAGLQFAAA